jgi:hypothetical protein
LAGIALLGSGRHRFARQDWPASLCSSGSAGIALLAGIGRHRLLAGIGRHRFARERPASVCSPGSAGIALLVGIGRHRFARRDWPASLRSP